MSSSKNTYLEKYYKENTIEAGIDEAGRGTLIGRVYTAAVIWNPDIIEPIGFELRDSKKISKKKRKKIRDYIIANAVDYAVDYSEASEIDNINILKATIRSMQRSVNKLTTKPQLLLVDGNRFEPFPYVDMSYIDYICITKGDDKYKSIAAASILAKVYHDEYIEDLVENNKELEKYDLLNNMGYGTKTHMSALRVNGSTKFHRQSFKPCQPK
tara:strand:+ start:19847 stop:20485 length:639 start_codon:yes stop_codon:yes gene_type:complete